MAEDKHKAATPAEAYTYCYKEAVRISSAEDLVAAEAYVMSLNKIWKKTNQNIDKKAYDGAKRALAAVKKDRKRVSKILHKSPVSKGKLNVLILSNYDYGGSGWMIKKALESTEKVNVFHVRGVKHRYGYPTDLQMGPEIGLAYLREKLKGFDIVHCKGDYPPDKVLGGVALDLGLPVAITVGGTLFRRQTAKIPRAVAKGKGESEDIFLKNTNIRFCLTPDLNYPWFRASWMPAAIEVPSVRSWSEPEGGIIRIGHSPSKRHKKGTDSVLIPAINILKKEGIKIELVMLEGMSHKECVQAKKGLTLFWDQSLVGFYGNSALEAMRYGVPTFCYLSREAIRQAGSLLAGCPVINFKQNPQSCAMEIKKILKRDLNELSVQTYEWTKEVHGLEAVGERYLAEYKKILDHGQAAKVGKRSKKRPQRTHRRKPMRSSSVRRTKGKKSL